MIFTTSTGEFTGFLNHPTERPVANFDLSHFQGEAFSEFSGRGVLLNEQLLGFL